MNKLYKIIEFEGHYLTNIKTIYNLTIDNMSIYKNNSIIVNKNMFEINDYANTNFFELSKTDQENFILLKINEIFSNYSNFYFNYFYKENSEIKNSIPTNIIPNPNTNIYFVQNNGIFNLLVLIFLSDNLELLNYFEFIIKNNKIFKLPDTLVILSAQNYQLITNYNNNNINYPIPLKDDEHCELLKNCEKNAYIYLKNYINKLLYIDDVFMYDTNTLSTSLAAQLII